MTPIGQDGRTTEGDVLTALMRNQIEAADRLGLRCDTIDSASATNPAQPVVTSRGLAPSSIDRVPGT